MATTEEYKNGGSASYSFSIEYIKAEDIKVTVDGTSLDYTATNPPAQTTEYTVNGSNVIFKQASVSGSTNGGVRIYRETDLGNSDSVTFQPGSSIRASDLNANHKLVRFSAQEKNQEIVTADIRNDAITNAKIADNQIDSEHYVDGSIDRVHLAADIVDGTKIADDSINTEHYVDASIYEQHILNSAVTSNKIADNAVTTTEILNGAVTTAKLAADAIDGTKLADNAINSEHYTDGSIDHVHLANDIIDGDNIQDNVINSEHYVDGSIDHVHLANDIIDGDNIQDDVVNSEHIAAGALDNEHYAAGSITSDKLNGATVVTNSEQAASTPNDTSFFTTAAAEARYFNASTGETIKDGQSFPDNDTTIATTAAINDRIIDLVDDVGGFVPIANETSFPTTNPDINLSGSDKGGTIVSVSAASTNLVPSGTTVTIANGRGSGLPVVITGVSATIPSGFGFLVETTTTDHTYAFHRLVPKATEVTTVATNATQVQTVHTNITNINAVATNATNINAVAADATDIGAVAAKATEIGRLGTADAVADMAILGTADVVADMAILGTNDVVADLNTLGTADVVADLNTLGTADVVSDMNALATSGNITAMSTCSTNIASINNASSNISSVNTFGDQYQVAANNPSTDGGGNALAAGDLYFNTSANELKVYNGSAWQGGVTASGSFASTTGNTFTGDNVYNDNVKLKIGTGSDIEIYHDTSNSYIQNSTNTLFIRSDSLQLYKKSTSERYIVCAADAAVKLFYDNSLKLETTSTGVQVTGRIDISGTGTRIAIADNGKIILGDGNDLQIYHDGSNSYISDAGTGDLIITGTVIRPRTDQFTLTNAAADEVMIQGVADGAVSLYHNGSKKVETTGNGLKLTSPRLVIDGSVSANVAQLSMTRTDRSWNINNETELRFYTQGADTETPNTKIVQFGTTGIQLPDNIKYQAGTGNDLQIHHNGTDSYIENSTGELFIKTSTKLNLRSSSNETMIAATPNAGVSIHYDNSKKFETTSGGVTVTGNLACSELRPTSHLVMNNADNQVIYLGASNDVQIYHSGTNTFFQSSTGDLIVNSGGTTSTVFRSRFDSTVFNNAANNQNQLVLDSGIVKLYTSGVEKFRTTSNGVSISGDLELPDGEELRLGDSNDLQLFHDGTNSNIYNASGNLRIRAANNLQLETHDGEMHVKCIEDGAVELYHDNSKKFHTYSEGCSVFGNLNFEDNDRLRVGNSSDLQIYHNGSNSLITNITGHFLIGGDRIKLTNPSAGHTYIDCILSGAVELYHNNIKTLSTESDGIAVIGPEGGNAFITFKADEGDDNSDLFDVGVYNGGPFKIQNKASGSWEDNVVINGNGSVELYHDNSKKAETFGSGFKVSNGGELYIDGNAAGGHCQLIMTRSDMSYMIANETFLRFYRSGGNSGSPSTLTAEFTNSGHFRPGANNTYDLGDSSTRWRNIYTNDLNLSNEGSSNDVDQTWGDWTIQEGESDLFLKNNRSGKKYKFNLTEVS